MFLSEVPHLFRVLASLTIILVLNKAFNKLTLSVVVGTLVLALWGGHGPFDIFRIFVSSALSANNILLFVVVMQVIWLSSQMSQTQFMRDLTDTVKGVLSTRTSFAVLPAIIGLLPMPGGAVFSAPLVEDCDREKQLSSTMKARINYWFRHIWEYWWPLYPGVILTIELTGFSDAAFALMMFPLSLISVLSGYLFLLKKIPDNSAQNSVGSAKNGLWRKLFFITSPIFLLIIVYGTTKTTIAGFFRFAPEIPNLLESFFHLKYLPMVLGITSAQLYIQRIRPLNQTTWKQIFLDRKTVSLTFLVFTIVVYSNFVQTRLPDGTFMMDHVREELFNWGIPVGLVIACIPFIAGLTTGLAVGMVGASFPVIMGLLGANPHPSELISTTIVAYVFGYMGMILSPVHICLVVTNRHFKTSFTANLSGLIKPCLMTTICALIYAAVIRYSALL